MASASPSYDLRTAVLAAAPGVILTRDVEAALLARYQANGFTPLTAPQILALTGTPPVFPVGMKRFADSNPATDGWSVDAVRGVI